MESKKDRKKRIKKATKNYIGWFKYYFPRYVSSNEPYGILRHVSQGLIITVNKRPKLG